jgi:hypothetical protein
MLVLQVAYDVMDVDSPQFQADFGTFKKAILEMEHRLGALIVQVMLFGSFAHGSVCHAGHRQPLTYSAAVAASTSSAASPAQVAASTACMVCSAHMCQA